MKLITIESPYAGEVELNEKFARAVCTFVVSRGDSPYASHLFFTQFLRDALPKERLLGIEGGFAWGDHADEIWFCFECGRHTGFSSGMVKAVAHYKAINKRCFVHWFKWHDSGRVFFDGDVETL